MRELKSVYIDRTGDWARSGNDTGTFYLKSEADKVIAELKDKLRSLLEHDKKEIKKQKRLRCMALAERCKYRMYHISEVLDHEIEKIYPNVTAVKRNTWKKERMYYWRNIWIKLAEKFKDKEEK